MKTYALVQKCDFEDVGMDAKSDAESASVTEQKPRKKSTVENSNSLPCFSVDDIGLESTSETREFFNFNSKATPNPTLLSQWILKTYSASEINQLVLLVDR